MSETYFLRTKRNHNFTIIDNTVLRDDRLTWKAKGLFVYLLHLPDDWKININDLVNRAKEGKDAVNSAIRELVEYGYIIRTQTRGEGGRFGDVIYEIVESPNVANPEFPPQPDLPFPGKPFPGNPQLLSTNRLRTNRVSTKKDTLSKDSGAKAHAPNKLIPTPSTSKKSSRAKDIGTMRKMLNVFTEDTQLLAALEQYFEIRLKKGLQPVQWKLILEELEVFMKRNSTQNVLAEINNAISGGYMKIIPDWKKGSSKQNSFDNTSNSKYNRQRDNFEAAKDDDGNPLEF